MNISNLLTLFRILSIPALVMLYYWQQSSGMHWVNTGVVVVFSLAAITDYLDGYLARKLNIGTRLGAFLDPVADKLVVGVALVLLVDYYHSFIILIPALIIIMREITVSALREWMNKIGQGTSIAVSFMGKVKTAAQLLAIIFLLDNQNLLGFSSYRVGVFLLYVAMILTLYSGAIYLQKSLKTFDSL